MVTRIQSEALLPQTSVARPPVRVEKVGHRRGTARALELRLRGTCGMQAIQGTNLIPG